MLTQAAPFAQSKPSARLSRARLLLVDEEIEGRLYYLAVLEHLGYEVQSCATYAEAADRLKNGIFDLLIVGQVGPRREGARVLARIAEVERPTPVVFLMASPAMSSDSDVMRRGTPDYVKKPLTPSEIAVLVAAHLR